MKPKTKLQIEVWDLHQRLLPTKEHEPYMISKHEFYFTTHYKNFICLECNHQWKPEMQMWQEEVCGVECPSCGRQLKKVATEYGGMATRIITFGVAEVFGRFQVMRYLSCWKHMSKKKKPQYSFHKLFEEWKDWEKDKRVIVGALPCFYGDGFRGTYEVRYVNTRSWRGNDYDRFASDYNCPGAQFLPQFEKYSLDCFEHDCDYRRLIEKVRMSPKIETLLKSKQKEILQHALYKDSDHSRYWPQIKITLRHKYEIKDPGIWYDYLNLLSHFGKDLHNPKFICPEDLNAAHDALVEKRRIQREQEKEANIKQKNKAYIERMKRFLNLEFVDGDLTIKPLQNIDDFKEEGKKLKHCVFTNDYYTKTHSLLFSARVNGVRTETVEFSIQNWEVIQCRGKHNSNTDHHDRILELMKKSVPLIRKASAKKKRNPKKQSA